MKTILSIIIVTLSFQAFSQLSEVPKQNIPEDYGYIVKQGQQMPDIKLKLTDGTTVSSKDLKGKVVMLQFTGSYCKVCREEMPHIENDIWKKHKSKDNFILIGVDLLESSDRAKAFAKEMNITYPLAADQKGDIFYKFAADGAGVTRNVIIDKDGKIAYLTRLFEEAEFNEMKEVIDLLLGST